MAPDTLRYDKRPEWLAEIGNALAEDRPWRSDADALAAVAYFAEHAGDDQRPVIDALFESEKPSQRMRALFIARLSRHPATLQSLETHASKVLDPATPDTVRMALGVMGFRGARKATKAILEYYDRTDDPAAVRALGRIWASSTAVETDEERAQRTYIHLLAHKLTLGPGASAESVDALLRVMTEAELDEFLSKWVPESFGARELVIAAAGDKSFDRARGKRIHEAFLKSPDPALVTTILWRTPHKLDPALVSPLLDDDRVTESKARVCDYAAARLEAIDTGLPPELPADEGLRERRLKKWRGRKF